MGFPKGRSGSSSLWSTTGFKPRGRYNLIWFFGVLFALPSMPFLPLLTDGRAGWICSVIIIRSEPINVNPASRGGRKADGVSKGEKWKLSPLVEHGDSNAVFDITSLIATLFDRL